MIKNVVFFTSFALIAISISVISIYKPAYNWDTLPYIASVFSLDSRDTNSIHKNTYEIVKNSIPEKQFEVLVTSNNFREEMYKCAKCFYQHLPYYKIRTLYIFSIYVLYKLGVNIVYTPVVISSISYFFTGVIFFVFLKLFCKNIALVFILSVLVMISPFLLVAASESSPNTLSGFIILLSLYSLYKGRKYLFFGLIFLSVLTRPDNLILLTFMLIALAVSKSESLRAKKPFIFVTFILAIAAVWVISIWAGTYGFSVMYEHSFGERVILPAEYENHVSMLFYLKSFLKWAVMFKVSFISFQLFIFSVIVFLKWHSFKDLREDFDMLILMAAALSIPVHYLMFPVMEDKYFIAQYLFIDIIFVKTILEKIRMEKDLTIQTGNK